MSLLGNLLGTNPEAKKLNSWKGLVDQINSFESGLEPLSNEDLRAKTLEFRSRLEKGETLDALLPEAFAVVREASKRTRGERHFDVQLLGGIAMHYGGIAEMRTGEGKTLVATLPAYLNALTGKGVHIVTVNDYLSRRDAVWMGQVYSALGLTVGVLNEQASFVYDPSHTDKDKERDETGSFHVVHEFLRPATKKEVYRSAITYGTNNQFGFDYLRDNLVHSARELAQREFHYAIVDEVDSILIDEARTPLIISANTGNVGELYVKFSKIASSLKEEEDYTVDEKLRAISLTDEGISKAEKSLGIENIYAEGGVKFVHHLETAVKAKALFKKDVEYVVKDDEVVIVDASTGRLQPGRRWSEGLHQAIEAKEGVRIKEESRTFASITFQNYFRMYEKLAGMTGTAATSKEEFYKVYGLETFVIPTNKPIQRIDHEDLIFQTEKGKMKAVASKVKELNAKGQPVLIGTVSIEHNELLSAYLRTEGVRHEILNAKNHEREGEIIAQAGKKGAVTIATNMAGRGVDIKLGGNPATKEAYEEIKSLGGLFVLGTERHDARRIDNQLRGRSGRQGDPGETQFFVSLEDNLMRIFAVDTIKKMMGRFNIPEDEPIENRLITGALEKAQAKIEGFNFDARKHVLEFDDVLNYQRKIVYEQRRSILLDESLRDDIRRIKLQTIDLFWVDHLEMMDYLRSSVNLRAYGQRDPLVEYKKEGLRFFKEMQISIERQTDELVTALEASDPARLPLENSSVDDKALADKSDIPSEHGQTSRDEVLSPSEKIGRNDPCWCGSGKKFKKCHGA